MSIELVRWQDAHHFLDEPDDYPDDYIVETVGTVEVQGSWLLVAQEVLPGGAYRGITRILRENVVDRIRLTSVREYTEPSYNASHDGYGAELRGEGETIR